MVGLAGLIASNYRRLRQRPLAGAAVHAAFYSARREVLGQQLPSLLNDLTALSDYGRYERYVAPLVAHMREGNTWDESRDIRKLWNIRADT